MLYFIQLTFSQTLMGSGEGRREKIDQHLAGFKPQTLLLMQRLLYHWATTQLIKSLVCFPLVSVVSKCSRQLTCSAFPQGAFPFQILGFREDESTDARHAKSETEPKYLQSLDKVNKGTLAWGLKGSYKSFRRVILPYHNYLAVGEWWERRSEFFSRRNEGREANDHGFKSRQSLSRSYLFLQSCKSGGASLLRMRGTIWWVI